PLFSILFPYTTLFRSLQTKTLSSRAGYTCILGAAVVCKCAGEMGAVKIVDQFVLPIDQPLRFFFCSFLCLFQRRVAQLHILDRLTPSSEIIASDLLSVVGKRCVPRSGLKIANLSPVL